MLTVLLTSLVAGAAFGLFARVLALAVGMIAFAGAITLAATVSQAWSPTQALGAFVLSVVLFQLGYLAVLLGRQLLQPPQLRGSAKVAVPRRSHPSRFHF